MFLKELFLVDHWKFIESYKKKKKRKYIGKTLFFFVATVTSCIARV